MLTIVRRYDPLQPRAADGKWGASDFFDMAGFSNVVEIEGSFGDLAMGVHDTGDVRVAFRENGDVRELDLGSDDIAELNDAIGELAAGRDDLPEDASTGGVYDDRWFGTDFAHKVELYGSGVIGVTFGADEEDPWMFTLDPPDDDSDDVDAFTDALDEILQAAIQEDDVDRAVVERKFNPGQLRVPGGEDGGQWSSGGAYRDTLKLDGKIDLAPDEHLVGSWKLDAEYGGVRMALTDQHGKRMLRLGVAEEGYGQASRTDGIAAWDGNGSPTPLSPADRQRLKAEQHALVEQADAAHESPERHAELEEQINDIQEQLTSDHIGFNSTAQLDEYSWRRLADQIRPALAEAVEQAKTEAAAYEEYENLRIAGSTDTDRMAELRRIARMDDTNDITFTSGIIAGSQWGDVHYSVEIYETDPVVTIGVTPKGAPDDWGNTRDWEGTFDVAETRKLLRLLDKLNPDAQRATAGPPAGGQFAAGGGRVGGGGKKPSTRRPRRATPAGPLSFDGKNGTGYGVKGGDPRVRSLQAALTRLGITDSAGKGLAPDGKYGPKTTSAVKKLQKALGLKPDGKVTPELLKQATELKQLPPAAKPARRRTKPPATRSLLLASIRRALRLGVEVRHPLLFDRAFTLDDIQISRSGDGRTVEAYAACFGQPYEVRDQHGHYMEVIDRAAFNRTLANGAGRQAMCLYNHGMSVVDGRPDSLAQVPIGTPLEIKADGRGLLTVTRYNKSALADSVLESIRNGDIRSQSFRGRIVRSSPDRLPARNRAGGLPTITRHELGLTDYGPTPIPVNASAEIMAVRSMTELVQDFAALDDDGRLELLRTLGIDLDGDETEETQGEAATKADDTPTSTMELGAQDSPLLRHSGGQSAIAQRARAGRTARRIPDEATH